MPALTAIRRRGERPGAARRRAALSGLLGLGVLLLLGGPGVARPQVPAPPAATVPQSDAYLLHSRHTGRDYRISVARPLGAATAPGARVPVAYLLDADELFGVTADTARLLADDGEIPGLLVVGIGYPIRSFDEAMEPRSTDFTPVVDGPYERLVAELTGGQRRVTTGGAAAFLQFIREELKPFIAARYAVDPADTAIIGHSLGGLFGLYALFQSPGTFDRYVIGSPCLLCGDRDLPRREAAYAASHRDLRARLYMNVGADEADLRSILNVPAAQHAAEARYLSATGNPDSVALFRQFAAQLGDRRFPSLQLDAVIEAGEGHESLPPILISRGLRAVYAARRGAPAAPAARR